MIREKTMYDVNGKTFESKEDALKEEMKNESIKNEEVAKKFIEIFGRL